MPDLSDDDLVAMFHDGDADAFDTLFDRYRAPVYNFARVMLGHADGAEDVLQETFLTLARAGNHYQPRGRFKPWLMRVTRNLCLNRIQSHLARQQIAATTSLDLVQPPAPQPTPAEEVERAEHIALLRRRIAELPDRQREAIVLYAFEQMPYRDIATALDVPIGTVKTLIHRARATLAHAFDQHRKE